MQNPARAVVHDGKIELLDDVTFPEGAHLVVSVVSEEDEERAFWLGATQSSLDKIWNNSADDVYEELL